MYSERIGSNEQDSATALRAVIDELDRAFAVRDYERVAELLETRLLEAWYGQRPERLAEMIRELASSHVQVPPVAKALAVMAEPNSESRYQQEDVQEAFSRTGSLEAVSMLVGRILKLRLDGHCKEAYTLWARLLPQSQPLRPIIDQHGGWTTFASLQHGTTALLAGDFQAALAQFVQAQFHLPVLTLPFLTRDAYVKYALIHSCFGDRELASTALRSAAQVPRTESWMEPAIDVVVNLVEAVLAPASDTEAVSKVLAIPVRYLGEMWPFYVFALQLVLERTGQRANAARQLEMLDMTALPRFDGEGFSGSVIPGSLAANVLVAGNIARARELLARADPDVPTTKIVEMMLAVISGRPADALRVGQQIQASVRGLRQLELWRFGAMSSAYATIGDAQAAIETVRSAVALSGRLSEAESGYFTPEVRDLARPYVEDWQDLPESGLPHADDLAVTKPHLTMREVEVLALVVEGHSRDAIAAKLFLSTNTVKAHWRSIYRKLGVTSRSEAIIEAERRGVL